MVSSVKIGLARSQVMTEHRNIRFHRNVSELKPLVSEEFPDQRHKPTLRISSEELASLRRHREVEALEEFDIPSGAPTLRLIGRALVPYLVMAESSFHKPNAK